MQLFSNLTIPVIQKNCFQFGIFILLFLFLFFYPGQNYYQTLQVSWKEPEVIPLPKAIDFYPALYPLSYGTYPIPYLTAKSAILIDVPSAVVLYEKNPDEKLFPASTTKIMTALVSLDHYQVNTPIYISQFKKEGAQMGLVIGDTVTVNSLLYGLLVNSGNDAASVLANHYPGGENAFVKEMNQKAGELHLTQTHFVDADGFSEPGHYMSALDLARLSTFALKNPLFAKIVNTKVTDVPDYNYKKLYHLENINKLLGMLPGINGIKTGWTEEAGECLVASAERNGHFLVSVILGSSDRFGETKVLLDWGFNNFIWQESQTTHSQ